jgi:hypothetical protein
MAYKLAANYKRYKTKMDAGGSFDMANDRTAMGMGIANSASGIVDSVFSNQNMGREPVGAMAVSGALKGAAAGTAIMPGIGTAVGAVAGGVYGLVKGEAAKKAAGRFQSQQTQAYNTANLNRSQAALAINPELAHGQQYGSFYAMGGSIETAPGSTIRKEDNKTGARSTSRPLTENFLTRNTRADGGSLTPLDKDSAVINGPSHEAGGVQLPEQGAEVEGGETMQGDFVFSDRLGFAQEHKKLASAIGRIQQKGVQTPEKVNSIRRMQDRVQQLALSQEYLKHILSGGRLPDPTQSGQPQLPASSPAQMNQQQQSQSQPQPPQQ